VTELIGEGKCIQLFNLRDKNQTVVAGLQVSKGIMSTNITTTSNPIFRIKRNNEYIVERVEANDSTLRRYKDVVNEVRMGDECGLSFGKIHKDIQMGDLIECYNVKLQSRNINTQEIR
jgi:translation initiation factor IF-2